MNATLESRRLAVIRALRHEQDEAGASAGRTMHDAVVERRLRSVEHQLVQTRHQIASALSRLDDLAAAQQAIELRDSADTDDEDVAERVPVPPLRMAGAMSDTASRALFGS